jgi:hypothetical protein
MKNTDPRGKAGNQAYPQSTTDTRLRVLERVPLIKQADTFASEIGGAPSFKVLRVF